MFPTVVWLFSSAVSTGQNAIGSAAYYRIMNCHSLYAGRCIEDSILTANKTQWHYIVTAPSKNNARQQWALISASTTDTTAFYIRNRSSYKYLNADIKINTTRLGIFYLPQYTSTRANATVWHFIRLSNGQYVITATDSYGVDRFLSACDSTKVPTMFRNLAASPDSYFAWHVVDADEDVTGIADAAATSAHIGVGVVNRRIIVSGTENYSIYDIAGRRQPGNRALPKGCYVVVAEGKSYRIIIK